MDELHEAAATTETEEEISVTYVVSADLGEAPVEFGTAATNHWRDKPYSADACCNCAQ